MASGGHSGLLRLVDCRRAEVGFVAAYGYEQSQIENYRKHFIHLDPYCDSLAAAPAGALLLTEKLAPLALRRQTENSNDKSI